MLKIEEIKPLTMSTLYGIWNSMKKEFQFGIKENTKKKATAKLFDKIGNDARQWRFEVRKLPQDGGSQ